MMERLKVALLPYNELIEWNKSLFSFSDTSRKEDSKPILLKIIDQAQDSIVAAKKTLDFPDVLKAGVCVDSRKNNYLFAAGLTGVEDLVSACIVRNECFRAYADLVRAHDNIRALVSINALAFHVPNIREYGEDVIRKIKALKDRITELGLNTSVSLTLSGKLNALVASAEEQSRLVAGWINENQRVFVPKDMAMYEAIQYCIENHDISTYYDFAECMYALYKKALSDKKIVPQYFPENGESRHFYFYDPTSCGITLTYWESPDIRKSLMGLTTRFGYFEKGLKYTETYHDIAIIPQENDRFSVEEIINLGYVASGKFFDEVKEAFKSAVYASNLLADIKKDQMRYLRLFLGKETILQAG